MAPIDRTEAAPYYFTYIDRIERGDIVAVLAEQWGPTVEFLRSITEEQSLHRYAPDKWTIKQVLNHINDCERVFTFRALWFARGFSDPLPSMDQNIAIAGAKADQVAWAEQIEEFQALRQATIAMFRHLPTEAWQRTGVASGNSVTVRALAYIVAGHLVHHLSILRERYLAPS